MLINLPEIMELKKNATGIETQVRQPPNPMLFTQCCLCGELMLSNCGAREDS